MLLANARQFSLGLNPRSPHDGGCGAFVGSLFSPASLKFFLVFDFLRLHPHASSAGFLLLILLGMYCLSWIHEVCL